MKEEVPQMKGFRCPVCGHDSYTPMEVSPPGDDRIGADYKERKFVVGYFCNGCTVQFLEPTKFSAQKLVDTYQEEAQAKAGRDNVLGIIRAHSRAG